MQPAPSQPVRQKTASRSVLISGLAAVLLAGLLTYAAHRAAQGWLLGNFELLGVIALDRSKELLAVYTSQAVVFYIARLGPPFALIAILCQPLRQRRPLSAIGLGLQRRSLVGFLQGVVEGYLWCGLTLLLVSLLAVPKLVSVGYGGLTPTETIIYKILQSYAALGRGGWAAVLSFLGTVIGYAIAKLVITHGHLLPLLRERSHPATAAVVAAYVFACSYLISPFVTPMAFLNVFLAGLLFERLRVLSGSLWYPLGMLAGWVTVGLLAGQPVQGMPLVNGAAAFAGLPVLLNGGVYGFEGGLVTTFVLALGLVLSVWPRTGEKTPQRITVGGQPAPAGDPAGPPEGVAVGE